MNPLWPTAVIVGAENFVARKLAQDLVKKDLNVIGIRSDGWVSGEVEVMKIVGGWEEVESKVNYIFDFDNKGDSWEKAQLFGARLTIVRINQQVERSETDGAKPDINWRLVEAGGVYGVGMDQYIGDVMVEILKDAMVHAVLNRNLVLPEKETVLRFLAVEDVVEGIMRASFLSGTNGERYRLWGRGISTEVLAKTLIEEAKMTRYKIEERNDRVVQLSDSEVNAVWERLRWSPRVELGEGLGEVLQDFFTRIEEERRREKKIAKETVNLASQKRDERKQMFAVMVDEELSDNTVANEPEPLPVKQTVVVEDEKQEEVVQIVKEIVVEPPKVEMAVEAKEEVVIKEEPEEIAVMNSNNREVAGEEVDLQDEILEEEDDDEVMPIKVVAEKAAPMEKVVEEVKVPKKRRSLKGWWKIPVAMMLALGLWMVVGVVRWGWTGYSMVNSIKKVETLIKEGKYNEVRQLVDKEIKLIDETDEEISTLGGNQTVWGRNYQMLLRTGKSGLELTSQAAGLVKLGDSFNKAIFNGEKIDWKKTTLGMSGGIKEVERRGGELQARLDGDWGWLPLRYKGWFDSKKRDLLAIRETLGIGGQVIDSIPDLVGVGGEKKYLVLFQNENEIRPGGGFIGSYGLLSFTNGALSSLQIKDVYEADGQLKGHVEPPEELKLYLNQPAWFMRDANWQASFPAAAKDIQWFLEKETGEKVDGVIGIDIEAARSILGVVGEVYVPDFKEKINKDNLYEQAEYYAETKFFPGSTQKASFLGALGKQLFEEIKSLKGEKQWMLGQAMIDLLERNEVRMAMNDGKLATVMNGLGWDGSIYGGKCAMERCLADYMYVVEANLGVNKANYFIRRNMEQTVDIKDNLVERVVRIGYQNTAVNDKWPGGTYKNYMRIYLPKDTNLTEVGVSDKQNNNKVISGGDLRVKQVGSRLEVGFLVEVEPGTEKTVIVKYNIPVNLSLNKDKFSYLLYVQKQPGFGDTGLVSLISYPKEWQPMQVQPEASLVGEKLLFNQLMDRDMKIGVEIGK